MRNLVEALSDLYDLGSEGITRENYRDLDRAVRENHFSSSWAESVLDRAGV